MENIAAWIPGPFESLSVSPARYTEPAEHEILVRNYAVAINPVDHIKQRTGNFMFSWIKYPFVLGEDIAGEVVAVGRSVTRFTVGDRVLAHAVGIEKKRNRPAEGAFQLYSVVLEHLTALIPPSLSYEDASVLPLGVSTAASALFQKDQLALAYPSLTPTKAGKTVVIWGGSTSVGSNAIQLAVAAGYDVVATASAKNHAYVRNLGAKAVFDYGHPDVVSNIVAQLHGEHFAGAVAIGENSGSRCIEIARACKGRKFVAFVSFPVSFDGLPDRPHMLRVIAHCAPQMMSANLKFFLRAQTGGVKTNYVWGSSLMDNEVSHLIYGEYLPKALAAGQYRTAPTPIVVGRGLASIQAALDTQKRGVSAAKIVVALD